MAEALNRNLFLTRVSGGLVYHRLFRDFLQRRLAVQNLELFVNLHVKAARWFEQNYQIDEAFEHYITAGLAEPADALINQVAQSYYVQGRVEILLRWNEQLQRSWASPTPNLSYICAAILIDRYQLRRGGSRTRQRREAVSPSRMNEYGLASVRLAARAYRHFSAGIITKPLKTPRRCWKIDQIQVRGNGAAHDWLRPSQARQDRTGDQLLRGSAPALQEPTAISFRLPSC